MDDARRAGRHLQRAQELLGSNMNFGEGRGRLPKNEFGAPKAEFIFIRHTGVSPWGDLENGELNSFTQFGKLRIEHESTLCYRFVEDNKEN